MSELGYEPSEEQKAYWKAATENKSTIIELRNLGTDIEITLTLSWHVELFRDAIQEYAKRYKGKYHVEVIKPICEQVAQKLTDSMEEQNKRLIANDWKIDQSYRDNIFEEVEEEEEEGTEEKE